MKCRELRDSPNAPAEPPMTRRHSLILLLCSLLPAAGHGAAGAQKSEPAPGATTAQPVKGPPTEWVEPSGHRVVRLTPASGGSSFYFHQNGYTASGDKLVIATRQGLAAIDLKTRKLELVTEGRVGNVVVGKKTRQVFYTKGRAVYATHLDTRATRKIAELPAAWGRGSGLAVNADETVLAGSATEGKGKGAPLKGGGGKGKGSLEARWAAKVPMLLYTVQVKTGA